MILSGWKRVTWRRRSEWLDTVFHHLARVGESEVSTKCDYSSLQLVVLVGEKKAPAAGEGPTKIVPDIGKRKQGSKN